MNDNGQNVQKQVLSMFQWAGAQLAEQLFALEAALPEDAPDQLFEMAWDQTVTGIREGVAGILNNRGIADAEVIAVVTEIALDSFTDRFDALNEAWTSKGGTA